MTIEDIHKVRLCPLKQVYLFGGDLSTTAFIKLLGKQSTWELKPIVATDMNGMPRTVAYELTSKLYIVSSDQETIAPALAGNENGKLTQVVFWFNGQSVYSGTAAFLRIDVHAENQDADIGFSVEWSGSDLYPQAIMTIKAMMPAAGVASMVIIQTLENQPS